MRGENIQNPVTVTWVEPTATDNSGEEVRRESTHVSGMLFPPGSTIVRYDFTDIFGNTASCRFTVTVTGKIQVFNVSENNHKSLG